MTAIKYTNNSVEKPLIKIKDIKPKTHYIVGSRESQAMRNRIFITFQLNGLIHGIFIDTGELITNLLQDIEVQELNGLEFKYRIN